MKLHTDREILRCIYHMYLAEYLERTKLGRKAASEARQIGPLVRIDVEAVAARLNCSSDLLFGRLLSDIGNRFRYEVAPRTYAAVFTRNDGHHQHHVNFPFLAGVLASMDAEHERSIRTWRLARIAIAVSFVSALAACTALAFNMGYFGKSDAEAMEQVRA